MKLDDLGIRQQNWEAHLDIQSDMIAKGNGVFTFVVRVNDGIVVDYICLENAKYTASDIS